jgi:hypothetical protein
VPRSDSSPVQRRLLGSAVALLLAGGFLVACEDQVPTTAAPGAATSTPTTESAPQPTSAAPTTEQTALAAVDLLAVKGRAQVNDYDRDLFGQAWLDVDRNGCDTRNDILRRDLTDVVLKPGTHGCAVLTGILEDPYSGHEIHFQRGVATSSKVQIDHVVALADAWQKGARTWSEARREQFANDPLNLLAVDGPLNQQKGAGDAATWLPPTRAYRCDYTARIVAVKVKYALRVTAAERDALRRVLGECSDQPLPTSVGRG